MVKNKFRLRYACRFYISFFEFKIPLGYTSIYYDGWNNQFNLGLICFSWLTPPLKGDFEE